MGSSTPAHHGCDGVAVKHGVGRAAEPERASSSSASTSTSPASSTFSPASSTQIRRGAAWLPGRRAHDGTKGGAHQGGTLTKSQNHKITKSQKNHKITPFPPIPPSPSHAYRYVPQFPLTGLPGICCPQTAAPCPPSLRANPSAGAVPARVDRLSQRSLRAPSGAATQQIGPPMRAIAGACTVTMATVRPNPPGRQRTFSCQKRRTLRGSDGFAPTTPIRSSTAAAPCSFALSLKPTGGHAE